MDGGVKMRKILTLLGGLGAVISCQGAHAELFTIGSTFQVNVTNSP
jgi:hypothetical protein